MKTWMFPQIQFYTVPWCKQRDLICTWYSENIHQWPKYSVHLCHLQYMGTKFLSKKMLLFFGEGKPKNPLKSGNILKCSVNSIFPVTANLFVECAVLVNQSSRLVCQLGIVLCWMVLWLTSTDRCIQANSIHQSFQPTAWLGEDWWWAFNDVWNPLFNPEWGSLHQPF